MDFLPIGVLILALATDCVAGDPPNRMHPVAWMGSCIAWYRGWTRAAGNWQRFVSGLILTVTGGFAVAALGWLIQSGCRTCPWILGLVLQSLVLKCTFSVRSLARAANSVASALESANISLARREIAYHLVSRDVSTLDASELSAATIESVAENTSDSVVAPLFYFALAGLPGALLYRFVNTCDAMLGYRTSELEWFGKPAARLDDLMNLIPSRLTALLMLGAGALAGSRFPGGGFRQAVYVWRRDHRLTTSPNAGHPMSAAAGILGVALEKRGHYRLGAELLPPTAATISHGVTLLWLTAAMAVLLFSMALLIWGLA